MTKLEYVIYCLQQGWGNVRYAIEAWSLVMTDNHSAYDVFDNCKFPYTEEQKVEATRLDFWDALEDDIYEKEFIEYLHTLVEEFEAGNVKTYPFASLSQLEELLEEENN